MNGEHTLSVIRPIPAESKTISFLDIQKKDDPLPCGEEEQIKVQYTVVGETVAGGFLDLMYLVSLSRKHLGTLLKCVCLGVPNENSPSPSLESSSGCVLTAFISPFCRF